MCLETLLSATIKNKQFYAIDFAKLAPFSYIPQLNQSNFNLSLFAYGSIKHLLCLSNGTLPAVSKAEFNSRLQHILNVLEIVCLESNLQEFHSNSWSIAKQYDICILKDIEQSFKSWETLDKSIDSSAWNFAIRMVPPVKNQNLNQKSQNSNSNSQKVCTTWNTFKQDGCSYEFKNPGESCVYLHQCSSCAKRGFPNRKHKSINCRDELKYNSNSTAQTAPTSTAPPPVVTSE